jgi:Papain family cysteine protease
MSTTHRTHPKPRNPRRLALGLLVALSLVLTLALSTSTGAGAGAFGGGIVPEAARTPNGTAGPLNPKKLGDGALLPKVQVNPLRSARALQQTLPASVDLSGYSVPVGHQGQIDSCTAWTIDYAMLGWYSRRYNRAGQPFHPMYTYSQIHLDNTAKGGGSRPTDALHIAYTQGNDTMAHYSRSTTDFVNLPTASERANAANWKISGYQTLFSNVDGRGSGAWGASVIKTALANGKPVAIAIPIRATFQTLQGNWFDDVTTAFDGRHAVLATGYDQYGLWIQNSWGTGWGQNGYARLSWRVVEYDVYMAYTISGFAATSTTDTTPPALSALVEQIDVPNKVTGSTVPVKLTFSATDASGVAAYQLQSSTNGAAYVTDTTVTTHTARTYALSIGKRYQFRFRAKDARGNWSAFRYSHPLTPGVVDDTAFTLGGGFSRYSWAGSTFGGTAITSNLPNDSIQVSFTGRDVAFVAPTFTGAGRGFVYCDGTYYGIVDLHAASLSGLNTVFWCRFAASAQHTMKIVLEGTAGRPRFDVDAFAVLR